MLSDTFVRQYFTVNATKCCQDVSPAGQIMVTQVESSLRGQQFGT